MPAKQTYTKWLQASSVRIARVEFLFILLYAAVTIASDAWHLIPAGLVLQRWMMLAAALAVNTIIWYAARSKVKSELYYRSLLYAQIIMNILIGAVIVYGQRGIASRAVALFLIPIVMSTVFLTRSALYATAALCASAYIFVTIRYQFLHPGEAYKVELYAEIALYCAVFFILAAILNVGIRSRSGK